MTIWTETKPSLSTPSLERGSLPAPPACPQIDAIPGSVVVTLLLEKRDECASQARHRDHARFAALWIAARRMSIRHTVAVHRGQQNLHGVLRAAD